MNTPVDRHTMRTARQTTRLVVVAVLFAMTGMWATFAYFIISSEKARIVEEQRVLARMARIVQEQTHSLFSLVDYFLVSGDLWFQNHPQSDPRKDPEFLKLFEAFHEKSHGWVDIRLVDAQGGLFYLQQPSGKALAQVGDRDYFLVQTRAATRGFFIAKPVLSRVTGQWGVPISYPLRATPRGIAVLFAAIENRVFSQPFQAVRTVPGGTITVAHRDGTVLFRSAEDDSIGKSLLGGWVWTKGLPSGLEGIFNVRAGSMDGRARIGAYTAVPDYPLVVLVTSATDDVLADWRGKSIKLAIFAAGATLAGGLVLWRLVADVNDMDAMSRELEVRANIDFLTQIPNRRAFIQCAEQELERAWRYDRPLSVLMLDVDHFKQVNDRLGHEVGDQVLKLVAAAVHQELRATDLDGRLGGEEFAVLLPETALPLAIEVANRICHKVEGLEIPLEDGQSVGVTLSVGVAERQDRTELLGQFLSRADHALYQAKGQGRNRVSAEGASQLS